MNDNEKRDFCTGCGLLPQRPVKPKAPVCGCKKKKCCKKNCCDTEFAFRKVVIPAALGDDVTGKAKPENGAYTNSYVEYEAGGAQYMYDSYGVYTKIEPGSEGTLDFNELENRPKYAGVEMTGDTNIPNVGPQITALQGAVQDEKEARIAADGGLQMQIDALAASSDVTDIVGTYAELEAYDTQHLKDNDIIKVLQDETHDDETTYYRWSTSTETFTLIGEEGPYYTKAAADQKFQDKLTAGDGVTIDSDNVISADGETIFYANLNETGTTRHIYKDINFTSAASAQDIIDANDKGQVILRGTSLVNPTAYSDSYLQNAFIMPHNNDYELVFLDRDLRHEYTASATTDTAFYYDASEIQPKLTAGTNVQITGTTISATDTTYSNFTGTDGVDPGTAGLVPAPATTDAGKYLKADGTWDSVQAGPTVVQTTGTSQTDVMSQVATSQMIYPSGFETNHNRISIASDAIPNPSSSSTTSAGTIAIGPGMQGQVQGYDATVRIGFNNRAGNSSVAIGHSADAGRGETTGNVVIGRSSFVNGSNNVAIGAYANTATNTRSVALGRSSVTTRNNEVSVGSGTTGNYTTRFIANVTDPTLPQDAATKNYTDNLVISYASLNGASAPTTATEAKYVGQLYYDTTNDDMYYCSAITAQGTTPETYTYTWNTIGGSSVTLYSSTGTNTDGAMTQLAASQMIYPSGSETNKKKIAIGAFASAGDGSLCISANASSSNNASRAPGAESIAIGNNALAFGNHSIAIGVNNSSSVIASGEESIAIGSRNATASHSSSIAIGSYSTTGRSHEVSIGTGTAGSEASYGIRYIAHVHDPQYATDAANKNYVDTQIAGTTETLTIATSDWTALSASDPYDYSATVTATTTISATSTVELVNDQAVLFGTHGFAIGSVDTVNNTVTIYSIGVPSTSVSLTIKVRS